jgi:hypothetical protein
MSGTGSSLDRKRSLVELAFASALVHTEPMNSVAEKSSIITVSYDDSPLVELTIGDTDFRIDPGKQGTAFSISTRPTGSWEWTLGGEARWDGSHLRCRAFERRLLLELSTALASALRELE